MREIPMELTPWLNKAKKQTEFTNKEQKRSENKEQAQSNIGEK